MVSREGRGRSMGGRRPGSRFTRHRPCGPEGPGPRPWGEAPASDLDEVRQEKGGAGEGGRSHGQNPGEPRSAWGVLTPNDGRRREHGPWTDHGDRWAEPLGAGPAVT